MSKEFYENNHNHNQVNWDAKEVGNLLGVVSEKVPDLFSKLFKILYSEESAREMGKAVGSLYKELKEAGIPQDVALKMTTDYMLSLKDVTRVVSNQNSYNNEPKNEI
ncbi:hypothetical protein [Bacillus sp. EAC]|uniref:hypothetical protein n=1 Tax=Bacillus sp. EAC TaxID=1978338 RepID=UPI000B438A2C|nr:hypothetical protein [Bacillus sp. EAC]